MYVSFANNWEEITEASTVACTCIAPTSGNHQKALEDWSRQTPPVRYAILREHPGARPLGYVRVLRGNVTGEPPHLWLADYSSGYAKDHPVCFPLIARLLEPDRLMVRRYSVGSAEGAALSRPWPELALAFETPKEMLRTDVGGGEHHWLLVN